MYVYFYIIIYNWYINHIINMGVSIHGRSPKRMVHNGKSDEKDDLGLSSF